MKGESIRVFYDKNDVFDRYVIRRYQSTAQRDVFFSIRFRFSSLLKKYRNFVENTKNMFPELFVFSLVSVISTSCPSDGTPGCNKGEGFAIGKQFYDAIKGGDEDEVRKLLLEREPSELIDPRRYQRCLEDKLPPDLVSTPLLYAIAHERENIAKFFMEKGANYFEPAPEARKVFYTAITFGLDSIVKFMMERGFDVTENVSRWGTYLHYAVARKRAKIVKLLCDDGRVGMNELDYVGAWPLKIAVCVNSGAEIVSLLLKAGSNVGKRDKSLNTVLHHVGRNGNDPSYDADIVNVLLSHRSIDKEARNMYGLSPLLSAARSGDERTFRALLVAGADIHARDDTGETVMHYRHACTNENLVFLSKAYGLNFEAEDAYGQTPLLRAVGDYDDGKISVKLLVNAGGNVNACNKQNGKTALYLAAKTNGDTDMLEFLLLYGADVGKMVKTPDFRSMTLKGKIITRNILIEAGAEISLESATEILKGWGCYDIVQNRKFVHFDDLLWQAMGEFLKNVPFNAQYPNLPHLLQLYEDKGTFALYKMLKKYYGKTERTSRMEARKWDMLGFAVRVFTTGTYFQPLPLDIAYDVLLSNNLYAWKFERLALNLTLLSYNVKANEIEIGDLVRSVIFSESFAPVL